MQYSVDVILLAYKPGKQIFELIKALEEQTHPIHKLIMMNTEERYFNEIFYGTGFLERYRNIEVHHLSAKEFDIMRFLLQSGSRNLSKETILAKVWGYDSDAVENHVEVYVGFLRKKLASIGSNIRIEAIRRMGYHLEVDKHD